jgi:DNA-binding response OmpR family regulator
MLAQELAKVALRDPAVLGLEQSLLFVVRTGKRMELAAKEYAILEYLARRQGQVVTREDLSEHASYENYDAFSNVIEVYMLRLRKRSTSDIK